MRSVVLYVRLSLAALLWLYLPTPLAAAKKAQACSAFKHKADCRHATDCQWKAKACSKLSQKAPKGKAKVAATASKEPAKDLGKNTAPTATAEEADPGANDEEF